MDTLNRTKLWMKCFVQGSKKHKVVVGSALHLDEQLIMDYNSSERRVDDELWK